MHNMKYGVRFLLYAPQSASDGPDVIKAEKVAAVPEPPTAAAALLLYIPLCEIPSVRVGGAKMKC